MLALIFVTLKASEPGISKLIRTAGIPKLLRTSEVTALHLSHLLHVRIFEPFGRMRGIAIPIRDVSAVDFAVDHAPTPLPTLGIGLWS